MLAKDLYDSHTGGGSLDVWHLVECLERSDLTWCAIGGIAVNHWSGTPQVSLKVDFVVSTNADSVVQLLTRSGFQAERLFGAVTFKRRSKVSLRMSTSDFYRDFPSRAVAADVHGMLMRVASLQDTFRGKINAWSGAKLRQGQRSKDAAEIARLVEVHPELWASLPVELQDEFRPGMAPVAS